MLFSRDLLLYAVLADTAVSADGQTITILFPEDGAYSFEVASIERNSFSLASRAAEFFGEDVTVLIGHGEKRKKCASNGGQDDPVSVADRDIPIFSPPASMQAPEKEDEAARQERGSTDSRTAREEEEGAIPFQGLVDQVLKWGGGEVVMIKRDDRAEDMTEDPLLPED
jgi:hypothetical protein